ncbi:hypothetical protein LguiB_013141 [Lonicera macranthoides]
MAELLLETIISLIEDDFRMKFPATEEGSEASIQLPLDEEIRIIKSEIGSSRGTRIRGFGSSVVKEPKKRSPGEPVQINLQMTERIAQQDARIAELEARHKAELKAMEERVTMSPIRTSAMPNTHQQIKERLLALQNAQPIASSSSQDSPALLVVPICFTTNNNAATTAGPICSVRSQHEATTGDDGKKKNKRGVVTEKKTAAIVRSLGRSALNYYPGVRGFLIKTLRGGWCWT